MSNNLNAVTSSHRLKQSACFQRIEIVLNIFANTPKKRLRGASIIRKHSRLSREPTITLLERLDILDEAVCSLFLMTENR